VIATNANRANVAPIPIASDDLTAEIIKVETANAQDALISAAVLFHGGASYGHGTDKIWLARDGSVHMQRADAPPFLVNRPSK
jgi:hypothetical protein